MTTKKVFHILTALCTLLMLCSCSHLQKTETGETALPADTLYDEELSGKTFSLSGISFSGETADDAIFKTSSYTIINIWGTFGQPSIDQLETLNELSADIASDNIHVIGICLDSVYPDSTINEAVLKTAKGIIEEKSITYPQYIPDKAMLYGSLNGHNAVPESFIIDKDGTVIKSFLGSRTPLQWSQIINELTIHD